MKISDDSGSSVSLRLATVPASLRLVGSRITRQPRGSPGSRKAGGFGYYLNSHRSQGFTLIELMVVVVILGILAVTIIPRFVGTTHDAKVSAAKSDVAQLQSAVERFYINMDRYPTTEEGLAVLTQAPPDAGNKWHGPYIQRLRVDPWGNSYHYASPGTHNPSSYDIWSQDTDSAGGGTDKSGEIGNW